MYAGISAGYGFEGKSKLHFPPGAGAFFSFAPEATGGVLDHSLRGSAWGLHLGQNHRFGNVVFGVEGGYLLGDIDGSSVNAFGARTFGPTTHTTTIKSLMTLTPRVGYTLGNWLPYIKAGLAAAEVESALTGVDVIDARPNAFTRKNLHGGWTAGLGVEYALSPAAAGTWVVGLEYNYYQFTGRTYGGQPLPDNSWPVQYTVKPTAQTVMAKLSYRF